MTALNYFNEIRSRTMGLLLLLSKLIQVDWRQMIWERQACLEATLTVHCYRIALREHAWLTNLLRTSK